MPSIPNDIPITFKVPAHEALMNVLLTGTLLKKTARTFFKDAPMSEAEFNLLMILRHSLQPLSQNDLSERLLVDKSNITGLIDRLCKSGAIERNPVPDDRRRNHITLTDQGKQAVDAIDPVYHRLVAEIMHDLTDAEYKTLIRLTRKVRHGLRTSETTFESGA